MPSTIITLAATLFAGAGLCSSALPKTAPVQNTTLYFFIREPTYPQNYDSDPVGILPAGDSSGQAVTTLANYNNSYPGFTFVPDKRNFAKNGANSGILLYQAGSNGVNSLNNQPVSTSTAGSEFLPGGSNPQNLFVGSGNAPVHFFYNFQSEDFGVITYNGSKLIQQERFFVCQVVYPTESEYAAQVSNLVFTPTGVYPGQGCENVTLIAST